MAKKRHTRHRRQRRHRRRTMKGGAFTQQELQQLQNNGFNEQQIEQLENLGVSLDQVMQHVDAIMNEGQDGFHGNSDDMTEQVMTEILNEHSNQPILDQSFSSQGTMNLDELNTSIGAMNINETPDLDELNTSNLSDMSGYTSYEAESEYEIGGRRRRKATKKRRNKKRKTRKQRGGKCYGNGVGANTYDPNYSIYNTNMLKLFPYKPN